MKEMWDKRAIRSCEGNEGVGERGHEKEGK
jgi:hypothetical protein